MEILKNLKFMCRICSVDTKKRRSTSYSSCYGIYETPGLIDKLQKYLNLKIQHDDELPKIVCSLCYKKLEYMEKFAGVAKKTECFLNDFIRISHNTVMPQSTLAHFKNEFNLLAQRAKKNDLLQLNCVEDSPPEVEDVIVNVSLTDPLTIDMGNKIVQAQQKQKLKRKQASLLKNHHQHFGDPFASTSKQFQTSTPKNLETSNSGNNLELKRQNLKMVLSNELSRNDTVIKPVQVATLPALVPIVSPNLDINVVPQIAVRNFAQLAPQLPYFNSVNDCLNLGSVIKDMDLLKLILKALKWTYNVNNLQSQIIRLKHTPFRDVMVDPNLLQDTDLMQILNSYLRPMLLQTQQMQTQQMQTQQMQTQQMQNNCQNSSSEPCVLLPSNISYKLPAETSVQVINVQPNGEQTQCNEKQSVPIPKKKPKLLPQKDFSVIVLSDSEDDIQNFEVSIDPNLFFTGGDSSNSNESLLANLNFQHARLQEQIRMKKPRRRKQTYSKIPKQNEIADIDEPESDILVIDEDRDPNQAPVIPKIKSRMATPKKRLTTIKPKPVSLNSQPKTIHDSLNAINLPTSVPVMSSSAAVQTISENKEETVKPLKKKTEKETEKPNESLTEVKDDRDDDIIWGEYMILDAPIPRRIKKEKSKSIDIAQKPETTIPTKTFADADSTTKNRYVALSTASLNSCIQKMDVEDHLEVSLIDRNVSKKPDEISQPEEEQTPKPKINDVAEDDNLKETITADTSCKNVAKEAEKVETEIVSTLEDDKLAVDISAEIVEATTEVELENEIKENLFDKSEEISEESCPPPSSILLSEVKTEELTCHTGKSSKDIKNINKIVKATINSTLETKKPKKPITAPIERRNTRSQKATNNSVSNIRPARKSKTFSKYYKGPTITTTKDSLNQKESVHGTRTATRAATNNRKRS